MTPCSYSSLFFFSYPKALVSRKFGKLCVRKVWANAVRSKFAAPQTWPRFCSAWVSQKTSRNFFRGANIAPKIFNFLSKTWFFHFPPFPLCWNLRVFFRFRAELIPCQYKVLDKPCLDFFEYLQNALACVCHSLQIKLLTIDKWF